MADPFPSTWRAIIREWAEAQPRIAAVYLFGSRAKGTARPDCDIDLAIILTEHPDWTALQFSIDGFTEAEPALQAMLPAPVHLSFPVVERDVWDWCLEHGEELFLRGA